MQKKFISLAIASAISLPGLSESSQAIASPFVETTSTGPGINIAGVHLYGQLNGSVDGVDNGANGTRTTIVNSNSSHIGLRGSKDLENGLSAIWQVESSVNFAGTSGGGTLNTTTGAAQNTLASRNSFLGLKSDTSGIVFAGRHDTPYKLATRSFDVFSRTIADNRTLMGRGAIQFDGREGNLVAYVTPKIDGFEGMISYSAGAEGASKSSNINGSAWSLAGIYGEGPLKLSLGYEAHTLGTAATGSAGTPATITFGGLGVGASAFPATAVNQKEQAYKVGVGYTFDAFTVNGVFEHTNDSFGTAGANLLGHNAYYLAGKYTLGSNAIKLAFTRAGNAGATGVNNGANQWAVGYDHILNKSATIYVLYTSLKNDSNAGYGLSGGADVVPASPVAVGATASALSVGTSYSF